MLIIFSQPITRRHLKHASMWSGYQGCQPRKFRSGFSHDLFNSHRKSITGISELFNLYTCVGQETLQPFVRAAWSKNCGLNCLLTAEIFPCYNKIAMLLREIMVIEWASRVRRTVDVGSTNSANSSLYVVSCHFHENEYLGQLLETACYVIRQLY